MVTRYSKYFIILLLFVIFIVKYLYDAVYLSDNYDNNQMVNSNVDIFNDDSQLHVLSNQDIKFRSILQNRNRSRMKNCLPRSKGRLMLNRTLIEPKNTCDQNTKIVLLVKSSLYRNSLRQSIRQTWAQKISFNDVMGRK